MGNLNWFQKLRLRAIETLAYWQGRVNTSDLVSRFGVSRVSALQDIHRYLELAPGNLVYRGKDRAYVSTKAFKNRLTKGDIDEWLALEPAASEYVEKPHFNIPPQFAHLLVQAIRQQSGVSIIYRSIEHPKGASRLIFPHTLVDSGFRWHVRAWCCLRNDFRDFNLSRMVTVLPVENSRPANTGMAHDELWNQKVTIRLKANPSMSSLERKLIESEFGMTHGELRITTRAALVMYTLQTYQVDTVQDSNVYKQRLVLVKRSEIEKYLWN